MDHDDDVEHLFSWLQTPELRYREFAGAREITDTVVIVHQQRANNTPVPEDRPAEPPRHDTQLGEEYPRDQFPDQGETRIEVEPASEAERLAAREPGFGDARAEATSVGHDPAMIAPEPVASVPRPTEPAAPPAGSRLLGGAYRENVGNDPGAVAAATGSPATPAGEQRGDRSLDAVFGRLAGGRSRLPDPRERSRYGSGLGPPSDRSR